MENFPLVTLLLFVDLRCTDFHSPVPNLQSLTRPLNKLINGLRSSNNVLLVDHLVTWDTGEWHGSSSCIARSWKTTLFAFTCFVDAVSQEGIYKYTPVCYKYTLLLYKLLTFQWFFLIMFFLKILIHVFGSPDVFRL